MKLPMFAAAVVAALALPVVANAVVVVNDTNVAGSVSIRFPDNQPLQNDYPLGAKRAMDISGAECGEGRSCRITVFAPEGQRLCVVDVTNNAATVTAKGPANCEVK